LTGEALHAQVCGRTVKKPMPADVSIKALAERVRDLRGWRRRAAAFAAGVVSVLAMAPFFAWPVLWVTLPVLVWLIDGASSSRRRGATQLSARNLQAGVGPRLREHHVFAAAEIGWWFGFGYFVAGLFWIGEAFLVEAEIFAVLLPFAVTLLPAGLALFYGVAAGIAAPFWTDGARRVLVLALALSATEWLRGHILSGFPWNTLGYALTFPLPLMQSAAVLGIYGLTLVAVLMFALPPVLWSDARAGTLGRRMRVAALAVALVPLAAMALLGQVRLTLGTQSTVPGVKIRVVQPSVPQREKWRPENQARIFLDHLALSATNPAGATDNLAGVTHLIWPEAAMPFLPLDHPEVRATIGRALPPGTFLVTGALRAESAPPGSPRARRIFNSILVFGEEGSLAARYDKIHLVPFGEYLPLQSLLEAIGLQQLTRLRGGFDVGVSPRPLLYVPRLPPAAPLICYEAIFPSSVLQGTERPGVLLNVTNDGWFGDTTGPRQHLHQARVRAVEEGLPLVRAANNGISAAVDGYGRILARLDLDARGTIDVALPVPLAPPLYARLGDMLFLAFWLAGAAAVAVWR
jgi:apolipoprotein N-acyltransferase